MANDGTVKIGTELDDSGFKSGLSKLGSVASTALKGGVTAIKSVATAASGAVVGLLALESKTEEYRVAQGKLNTAFETAGYSIETAAQSYNAFYGILGDTDTATEASQLLAKLAESEEDVSTWTNIAAGVFGTFGDSLPIEGLIEASNETAKVGTVTGVFADALNWAGISEDEFNEKLAACTDESERNQLIMDTLAGTYDDASDAFYRNNEALVASREAQAQMDSALAELGQSVSDLKTRLIGEFLPSISQVTTGLAGMLSGTQGADQQFSEGIGNLIDAAVARLPEFLDFGVQILTSILNGIIENLPTLVSAIPQIIESLVNALQEMWPDIKDAGGQVLLQVAEGLVQAIPKMIAELPEIIASLIQFFADNFPEITRTGFELLGELIGGIISAIPEIAKSIPDVIFAIVDALKAGWESIKDAGRYLLEGLWSGISDKVQWLKNKVSGVIDTIKGWFTGKDGFDEHSPSKWSKSVMEYVMEGLAIGAENGSGKVLETVDDIIGEIKDRVSSISDALSLRQDVGDLQYELWERTVGSAATEEEKFAKQLELLQKQQTDQEGIIEAASAAYQAVAEQYGENSAESYEYQKTLLEEMLAYQDIIDKINELIEAKKELGNVDISSAIPAASFDVSSANAAMTPSSVSTPRFSVENAVASAAGLSALSNSSNSREIVLTLNGREVARGLIDNIRTVEKQTPAIQFN